MCVLRMSAANRLTFKTLLFDFTSMSTNCGVTIAKCYKECMPLTSARYKYHKIIVVLVTIPEIYTGLVFRA